MGTPVRTIKANSKLLVVSLHRSVIAGHRDAQELIAERFLDLLGRQLRRAFPRVAEDPIHDGVVDAIMAYITRPGMFDSSRGMALSSFLYQAGWRNIADLLDAEGRRRCVEASASRASELAVDTRPEMVVDMNKRLSSVAGDARERQALAQWLTGSGGTDAIAATLGVGTLPEPEKRREVKRFKDRMLKRLARVERATWSALRRRSHMDEVELTHSPTE